MKQVSLALRGDNGVIRTLPVEWRAMNNGSQSGWVDRRTLGWPEGPWDNEPDVVIWSAHGVGSHIEWHVVVMRDSSGRWIAFFLDVHDPQTQCAELFVSFNQTIGPRLPEQLLVFRDLGLANFPFGELLYDHTPLAVDKLGAIRLTLPGASPCTSNMANMSSAYVTLDLFISKVAQVLRLLTLDDRLHPTAPIGNLLMRWEGKTVGGAPSKFDPCFVKEWLGTIGPIDTWSTDKSLSSQWSMHVYGLWTGDVAIHTYTADKARIVSNEVEMLELGQFATQRFDALTTGLNATQLNTDVTSARRKLQAWVEANQPVGTFEEMLAAAEAATNKLALVADE